MRAVQVPEQLVCETTRRRWLSVGVWLLLLSLCIARVCGGDTPPPMQVISSEAMLDECYDEYLLASSNALQTFNDDYKTCERTANQSTIDLSINVDVEREQIEEGREMLCGNFQKCNDYDDNLDFFACTVDSGSKNLQLITEINGNATSAKIRLKVELGKVQQRFLLCSLEAQRIYMDSMWQAHEEWHQCRFALQRNNNELSTTTEAQN